jgi:hypothetical protein
MADLKKHIKKKYLLSTTMTEEQAKEIKSTKGETTPWQKVDFKKVQKDKVCFLWYDSNTMVLGFQYMHQGQVRFIPEPDPVLMYFNSAYYDYKNLLLAKKTLLSKLVQEHQEDVINELYNLFSCGTGAVINLFTTLEAFINRAIPSTEFTYTKKIVGKRTEVYTKEEIERNIGFDEKINDVLAQVYKGKKKPFKEAKRPTYDRIWSLKQFRDELVHLKSHNNENLSAYSDIYKKLLEYNYEGALNAVKDFCNYYHQNQNYIEECGCSIPD